MNMPAKIMRALGRHGFGVIRIVLDRAICATNSRGIKLFRPLTVAKAAGRIYRWKTAAANWDKVQINRLSTKNLEQMTTSLLKTLRWQDTINVVDFATKTGRASLNLELARAEAHWRLKDQPALEASRQRAIALLNNPTPGAISLINNENQVINIASRLDLLLATEPRLAQIQKQARELAAEKSESAKAFVYWNSGLDKAPKLVRTCVAQMRKVYGSKLVELSEANLDTYLPREPRLRRVLKLWPANYSDAIRVGLLARHGGVWLDATLYVNEDSTEGDYFGSDFFVYRYNGPRIASWFMVAKPGSYQARLLYSTMLDYWSRNRKLKNYFLFHDFFEVLYHLDPQFNQLWRKYSEDDVQAALQARPVQKLTYKPGKKPHGAGTLYSRLISQA
jgi:hypothetical protein